MGDLQGASGQAAQATTDHRLDEADIGSRRSRDGGPSGNGYGPAQIVHTMFTI